jgi:transcriptional regulator
MHTPGPFRADSAAREACLVRTNPFGLLVSTADGVPVATHVPMLRHPGPSDRPGGRDALLGATVVGHMARANNHWHSLSAGQRVLAVFSGPDGYVSPTLYRATGVAPTWNYAAVHLTGTVRVIDDAAESLAVLRATIDLVESGFPERWDPESSMHYIERILPGITAFEITVRNVQSTFKLSQDKNPDIQRRVHDHFAASPQGRHRELASLMADVRDRSHLMPGA